MDLRTDRHTKRHERPRSAPGLLARGNVLSTTSTVHPLRPKTWAVAVGWLDGCTSFVYRRLPAADARIQPANGRKRKAADNTQKRKPKEKSKKTTPTKAETKSLFLPHSSLPHPPFLTPSLPPSLTKTHSLPPSRTSSLTHEDSLTKTHSHE